ncbi:DUF2140 family protein [Aerococcus kribbianus]|uniref:DUF2140 family protein n=1 Tax=Aerococcus kribbianus TaxID=2999064 RepID=A0A9X3FV36_9LACT|nr:MULTISPECIES: DUF2140 family protein [unclassified Aerococcus]MCZ0716789.1 DUF2140 family protein [Aerococcus sp. YH-aer221]MCZ0725077.1 DUF2140 family protein [Aerococcus sp. YH-aer222]
MKQVSVFWRWACLVLLAVVLLPIIWLFAYLTFFYEAGGAPQATSPVGQENIAAQTAVSTQSFNALLEAAIGGDQVPYQLQVTDAVYFSGQFNLYGQSVDYEMVGQPEVDDQGNIRLQVQRIDVAGIDLPIQVSLALFDLALSDDVPLETDADNEALLVRLDQVSDQVGLAIRAQSIDLEQDHIELDMAIPVELIIQQIEKNQE